MSFTSPIDQIKKTEYDDLYFQGQVTEDDDPEKLERIKVRIEGQHDEIADEDLPWVAPMKHRGHGSTSSTGSFGMIPMKGSWVNVVFQRGDPHYPLYLGGVLRPDLVLELSRSNYPYRYGWIDRAGNRFWVDTKDGSNEVHFYHASSGSELNLDNDGNLQGHITGNADVSIDKNVNLLVGQVFTVKAAEVHIEATGSVNLKSGENTNLAVGENFNAQSGGRTNLYAATVATLAASNKAYITDKDGTCSPPC